eukprot:1855044-Rhodomonas_salina.2
MKARKEAKVKELTDIQAKATEHAQLQSHISDGWAGRAGAPGSAGRRGCRDQAPPDHCRLFPCPLPPFPQ